MFKFLKITTSDLNAHRLNTGNWAMKRVRFASGGLLLALSAFPALAADLPSRKSVVIPPPPPPMWTGFYAGLNAGYGFGTNGNVGLESGGAPWIFPSNLVPPPGAPVGPNTINAVGIGAFALSGTAGNTQSGFIGGAQIGYNYQYGSNVVLGVEADIQGSGIRGTSSTNGLTYARTPYALQPANANPLVGAVSTGLGTSIVQGGIDWMGTVRGRIGYLWTPTLLLYGTGGLAYGGAYANIAQSSIETVVHQQNILVTPTVDVPPFTPPQTNSWVGGGRQNQILTGWTAGGGIEWMFMPNWSLKAEALYWDLGRMNIQTATYGVSGNAGLANNSIGWGRTSVQYSGVQAKAGVNYHFNWGSAPVVASY